MAIETKMVNMRIPPKEIKLWKTEATRRYQNLTQFVRQCVREELRRKKSLPANGDATLGRTGAARERARDTTA